MILNWATRKSNHNSAWLWHQQYWFLIQWGDAKVEPQFCLALTTAMGTSDFNGATRKSNHNSAWLWHRQRWYLISMRRLEPQFWRRHQQYQFLIFNGTTWMSNHSFAWLWHRRLTILTILPAWIWDFFLSYLSFSSFQMELSSCYHIPGPRADLTDR